MVRAAGTEAFSLRAAAKSAQVDPAAVYRHFRDKQALLDAVAEDGFVRLADEMHVASSVHARPAARLRAVGEAYVRFAVAEPRLFRLMFGASSVDPEVVARRSVAGVSPYGILLGALEELRSARQSSLTARRGALPAWSAVHGLAELVLLGWIDDLEAALRDVVQTLIRGLAPDDAS
jgi:AcrR family transcriptional regulator